MAAVQKKDAWFVVCVQLTSQRSPAFVLSCLATSDCKAQLTAL